MEIQHKFIEEPMFSESQLFYDQHKMFREIFERARVTVYVRRYTKTTLSVKIKAGMGTFLMNTFDERFKQHKVEDYNLLSHQKQVHYYFKITKHQGLQDLIEYVETSFKNICYEYEMQGLKAPKMLTMQWEETEPIRDLQIKQSAA